MAGTTDVETGNDGQRGRGLFRGSSSPLLPEAGASGRPLMVVIAVLAFMASVALAGYAMVSRATATWTGDLEGTITVQVKGATPADIAREASAAAEVLRAAEGVIAVNPLTTAETMRLLEPHLGSNDLWEDFPVPAMISVDVSPSVRQDLTRLRTALAAVAPNASVDDHSQWTDRLVAAADRIRLVAFLVFAMVVSASSAIIIFATRAGLAANRPVVDVMHLVGATDRFIAAEVQQRYLFLSLRGAGIGAGLAALLLLASSLVETSDDGLFLPNLAAEPTMLWWLAIVPVMLCAVAALSARLTVLNVLRED